ncbi:MAG: D-sedoheptulose 7-phosphate isomerase [Pseudolabrys sp.]|nr:D-sedoheptulose 7-phosphate isomerase [Pseudolabrys sp.]
MPFDALAFYRAELNSHRAVAGATQESLVQPFAELLAACIASIKGNGKLMFFGNGGSAADAQHLAAELTIRYKTERPAIAAIALTTDTSMLTACGNDLGFDHIFERQVEALGRPGDVAFGLSTSGSSRNVLLALKKAKSMGIVTAAFSGKGGGQLPGLAEHLLVVPSDVTARIQEMHITLGHILCAAIEIELGFAEHR